MKVFVKKQLNELLLTFSNKKSLYSSKRIERFILFLTALVMCTIYFIQHINNITIYELMALCGMLFTMAGFTLHKTEKNKFPPSVSSSGGKEDTPPNHDYVDIPTPPFVTK